MSMPEKEYLSIKQASKWATQKLGKKVTSSNIAYLVQYGRIKKYGENGQCYVLKEELAEYLSPALDLSKNLCQNHVSF